MNARAAGRPWRFALVVLSDKAARGERQDDCLAIMRAGLPAGSDVVAERILADDRPGIEALLIDLCDKSDVDCVLTSGGTGLGPRDNTPQATLAVADYEVPGLAEAMRAASLGHVRTAMLSRAVAAVRRATLIVNLPGSPKGTRETLAVIVDVIPHALALLRGELTEHAPS
ncbi:MAG TPA: MogA/MoaB family molybdenum cofactor biosynthesis protein [Candidatus Tumulicola sp.]|nr:MogA/MoaB family molybdenum cofactor biosynthesis protein [Candidatus Tumulicola sp.]